MTRLISITLVSLLYVTSIQAQQAPTRVEGKITDPVTHKPVGCSIQFVGPNGKKTKITSNSSDGTYLAVINEAGMHKIYMAGYNVYREEFSLNIPEAKRFQEIKQDYSVRALTEGDLVAQLRAFDKNQATLTSSARTQIESLKETLNKNQQMNVVITVLPDEDQLALAKFQVNQQYLKDSAAWSKQYKAWEKKYKKKTVKPEPPVAPVPPSTPADPNQALLAQRKSAILSAFADVKNADLRIEVVTSGLPASAMYQPGAVVAAPATTKSKKGKKSTASAPSAPQLPQSNHDTLILKVGKVKRLLE